MRASFEAWLHRQWAQNGPLNWLLLPLSSIYGHISRDRRNKAIARKLPVPVVVVGNIYVGGTGKTPITIEVVKALRQTGHNPGVISRGYGRAEDRPEIVSEDSSALTVGDEPLLIAKNADCPVAVGSDRYEAGKLLLEKNPEIDVIVSDDGLQHYRLHRDIELAVVGARGIGNGWVLPAGPLREPPSRLDEVDALILNGTRSTLDSPTPRFAATSHLGDAYRLCDDQCRGIDEFAKEISDRKLRVAARAGIAAPSRFFAMLRAHDIENLDCQGLGDHYDFRINPFAGIDADVIFITAKDAVKCRQFPDILQDERIWVVELEMRLDDYLIEFLAERLEQISAGKTEKETA